MKSPLHWYRKHKKNRANVSSPAPILAAGIGNIPEHERAVIDAGAEAMSFVERGLL
jgi:hypothetical protein